MAARINPIFRKLIRERKITPTRLSRDTVLKELRGAEADLHEARESVEAGKFKWATVQGYYSAFHSARALLYNKGFREKSHRALLQALKELYGRDLQKSTLDDFEDAMSMREAADYGLVYSEEAAMDVVETAEDFLDRAKLILRVTRSRDREHE